jgi:hypothetical protein
VEGLESVNLEHTYKYMEHKAKGAAVVGSVQNILFSSCFASVRELAVVTVFTVVVYDLGLLVDPAPTVWYQSRRLTKRFPLIGSCRRIAR